MRKIVIGKPDVVFLEELDLLTLIGATNGHTKWILAEVGEDEFCFVSPGRVCLFGVLSLSEIHDKIEYFTHKDEYDFYVFDSEEEIYEWLAK